MLNTCTCIMGLDSDEDDVEITVNSLNLGLTFDSVV